jgi:hypothetical protein
MQPLSLPEYIVTARKPFHQKLVRPLCRTIDSNIRSRNNRF